MLANIKLLLGITDTSKDNLLTLLISMATDEVKNFTHNDDVDELESTIDAIVVYQYNMMGSENLTSEDYAGASYEYRDDYPESIKRSLRAHRKVRVIE